MKTQQIFQCPRCGQPPLETIKFEGQQVERCTRCSGLWCEIKDWQPAQLGPVPQFGREQAEVGSERAPDITYIAPSRLACPQCVRPLDQLKIGEPALCTIDQCAACGGVWFDHSEWENLEALRQWPAEQQRIGKVLT